MNRQEIIAEIKRTKAAIAKSSSYYLKTDYGKHLKKLYKQLKNAT